MCNLKKKLEYILDFDIKRIISAFKSATPLQRFLGMFMGIALLVLFIFLHFYIHETGHVAFGAASYLFLNPDGNITVSWKYENILGLNVPRTTHFDMNPPGKNPLGGVGGFLGTSIFLLLLYAVLPKIFGVLNKEESKYLFKHSILMLFIYEGVSQLLVGYDGLFGAIADISAISIILDFVFWGVLWLLFSSTMATMLKEMGNKELKGIKVGL